MRLLSILFSLLLCASALATPNDSPAPGATTNIGLASPTMLTACMVTEFPSGSTATLTNLIGSITNPVNYTVTVNGTSDQISSVGIRRIPLMGTTMGWDLRVENALYFELTNTVPETASVTVTLNVPGYWVGTNSVTFSTLRTNQAIHVPYCGYELYTFKRAFVGLYCGTLGELAIPGNLLFNLIDTNGVTYYTNLVTPRVDQGWVNGGGLPYQQVMECNFDRFNTPGVYRVYVPGYGCSLPFRIGYECGPLMARTYAQGMFNQRCGYPIGLPYSRFAHPACHTRPVDIPITNGQYASVDGLIAGMNGSYSEPTELTNIAGDYFQFVNTNQWTCNGGHHDAGDYSTYMVNMSSLSEILLFAVDSFPGVNALDNLGIPESGDGIPDLLQEMKWETDCILAMQDTDGGFAQTRYPRNEKYETLKTPDQGDNRVVLPKTIVATMQATAILAEASTSPNMRRYYPAAAYNYWRAAQAGYSYVTNAYALYGTAAYQTIGGDLYTTNDANAWMQCEMYLATGNPVYQTNMEADFGPNSVTNSHWNWVYMNGGYGCVCRSYATAVSTGRLPASAIDTNYLALCRAEITNWAASCVLWSQQCSYGSSMPVDNKHIWTAGWYFSPDYSFDIATALVIDPGNAADFQAVVANLAYEWGCNPCNYSHVMGVGGYRQTCKVSTFNQASELQKNYFQPLCAPTGVHSGNMVAGLPYTWNYQGAVGQIMIPPEADSGPSTGYPLYDRQSDLWDVASEPVGPDQCHALAAAAFLMAKTPYATNAWTPTNITINIVTNSNGTNATCTVSCDTTGAEVVWESFANPIGTGPTYTHNIVLTGDQWVECEILYPDGRRLAGSNMFPAAVPAVAGWPTVSIATTVSPAIEGASSGSITISRDTSTLSSNITVNYLFGGGCIQENDLKGWLLGSDYQSCMGAISMPAGVSSVTIPVTPTNIAGDLSTKTFRMMLTPGPIGWPAQINPTNCYNIAYPGYASVVLIRTNAPSIVVTSNAVVPSVLTVPAYATPSPISPPSFGLSTGASNGFAAATNIDHWGFVNAAISDRGTNMVLTNMLAAGGLLYSSNLAAVALTTNVIPGEAALHGIVFSTSIFVQTYNGYGTTNAFLVQFIQQWFATVALWQNEWASSAAATAYGQTIAPAGVIAQYVTPEAWHDIAFQMDPWGYVFWVDGSPVSGAACTNAVSSWQFSPGSAVDIQLGAFTGAFCNLAIKGY